MPTLTPMPLMDSGAADIAYSSDGAKAYVAGNDGTLRVYNVANWNLTATYDVGTNLGPLALSDDGQWAYVIEQVLSGSGPEVYRVNLTNGATTKFTGTGNTPYIGLWVESNNDVVLTGGGDNVMTLNPETGNFSLFLNSYYSSDGFFVTESGRYTLMAQTNISNGQLYLYDNDTDKIVAAGDNYQAGAAISFNRGVQAFNASAGFVAQGTYSGGVNIFDINLKFVTRIADGGGGLGFSSDGAWLYKLAGQGELQRFSTLTWQKVDSITISLPQNPYEYDDIGFNGAEIVSSASGNSILVRIPGSGHVEQITVSTISDQNFTGTSGADSMAGAAGDDIYLVNNAGDVVTELENGGFDRINTTRNYVIAEDVSVEVLAAVGTTGLALTGNSWANALYGNGGNDILNGGGGKDYMVGGAGNDRYYVDSYWDRVVETTGGGSDQLLTSDGFKLGAGVQIEYLWASNVSSTDPMNLYGNEFNQQIIGNAGRNWIDGGQGSDEMRGLGGDDTYFVDHIGDRVFEAVGAGSDILYTRISYALTAGQHIEYMETTNENSTVSINLTGNEIGQQITGNAGANIINGMGGSDTLIGRGGNDRYYVDNIDDKVFDYFGEGFDGVLTSVSYTLLSDQEIEYFWTTKASGTDTIHLTGNNANQQIIGNNGTNYINGLGGADEMRGLGGNDRYYVDNLGDRVFEAVGGGYDTIITSVSLALTVGQEIDGLATSNNNGTSAMNLWGNEFSQYITGNAAANVIDGKGGTDRLTGFGGADRFEFTTALGSGNVDQIMDFVSRTDVIALDDAIFGGIAIGRLSTSSVVMGTQALDADDRIIYNIANGALYYDADGNGAGAAVYFANIGAGTTLAASDILVY